MNYLGLKIANTFDDDLDIQGHDLDGVKDIQAKQLNVENKIVCTSLVVNEINLETEILVLRDEIKRLQNVIKNLVEINLDVS